MRRRGHQKYHHHGAVTRGCGKGGAGRGGYRRVAAGAVLITLFAMFLVAVMRDRVRCGRTLCGTNASALKRIEVTFYDACGACGACASFRASCPCALSCGVLEILAACLASTPVA